MKIKERTNRLINWICKQFSTMLESVKNAIYTLNVICRDSEKKFNMTEWYCLKINYVYCLADKKFQMMIFNLISKYFFVSRTYFRNKFLWSRFTGIFCINFGFSIRCMHTLHVFFQLVFSLKLFSTILTKKFSMVRMAKHMQFKFIRSRKNFFTFITRIPPFRMKSSNVLAYLIIFFKYLKTKENLSNASL